jgi:hypothetical protein
MRDPRALPPTLRISGEPIPLRAQEPELLTIPRAAKRAGVGVRQLRQAIRRGELPVFRLGAWPRVRWVDVIRWICAHRVPATSHARRRVAEVLARESRRSAV